MENLEELFENNVDFLKLKLDFICLFLVEKGLLKDYQDFVDKFLEGDKK